MHLPSWFVVFVGFHSHCCCSYCWLFVSEFPGIIIYILNSVQCSQTEISGELFLKLFGLFVCVKPNFLENIPVSIYFSGLTMIAQMFLITALPIFLFLFSKELSVRRWNFKLKAAYILLMASVGPEMAQRWNKGTFSYSSLCKKYIEHFPFPQFLNPLRIAFQNSLWLASSPVSLLKCLSKLFIYFFLYPN